MLLTVKMQYVAEMQTLLQDTHTQSKAGPYSMLLSVRGIESQKPSTNDSAFSETS